MRLETVGFHELLVFFFVLILSVSVFIGQHSVVVRNGWAVGKFILKRAIEGGICSVNHEHSKMAMFASTKWGGDGSCVDVEFKLELMDGKQVRMFAGVQRSKRVMRKAEYWKQ